MAATVSVMAGIPELNAGFYWRARFTLMDPCARVEVKDGATPRTTLIVRDIEMERARAHAKADEIKCPRDFAPAAGLSGDREIATAQALTECVKRTGARTVRADRSLPLVYADELRRGGITVELDCDMAVLARRSKDEQEIGWLHEAQRVTEEAMRMACEMVARAEAGADGTLRSGGSALTCEGLRERIALFLTGKGYEAPASIVAGGPQGSDCHERGSGALRTSEPVIIDIFPRNRATLYNGDCTRTVVHGAIPPEVARMHGAVARAKRAATSATCAGATGDTVHRATVASLEQSGYPFNSGGPPAGAPQSWCGLVHGTGHGVGISVHEAPLLDFKGVSLLVGDCVTIEPGLYCQAIGGIRLEDMVVVTADGTRNLNSLPEGLSWK